MKKNCKTLHTLIRTFTEKQNEKGGGKTKELIEVDKNRHNILTKILTITNNEKMKYKYIYKNDEEVKQWRKQIAELNEKLIEIGLIVNDDMEENKNEYSNI